MDAETKKINVISAIRDCIHDIQIYDDRLKELSEEITELTEHRVELVKTLGQYMMNRKQYLQQSAEHSSPSANVPNSPKKSVCNTRNETDIFPLSADTLREEHSNMSTMQRSNILDMLRDDTEDFFREDAELRKHMDTRRKKMHEMTDPR